MIPPVETIAQSPTVCVEINRQWVSHVMGRLEPLTRETYWTGDAATTYAASQEAERLMLALATGVCMQPVGSVIMYAGSDQPDGWLVCDGAFHLKADFPDLYALLTGNVPETTTTFATPDWSLRSPMGTGADGESGVVLPPLGTSGALTHTLSIDEMPSHNHTVSSHNHQITPHSHPITPASHSHNVLAHNHAITPHSHPITPASHSHTVNGHTHDIPPHAHGITPNPHSHQVLSRSTSGLGAQARLTNSNNNGVADIVVTEGVVLSVDNSLTLPSSSTSPATNSVALTVANNTALNTGDASPATNGVALTVANNTALNTGDASPGTSDAGGGEAHINLHPVFGITYLIRAR